MDQACREQIAHFLPILLEDLEAFRPRLAFLSGSAALGEAVGASLPEVGATVLSDLDLGVVTELPVPRDHNLPVATSPVEVGVGLYLQADLSRQDPTLGLVDCRRHGLVLWGDSGLLQQFPAVTAATVPVGEAVRLVGNRSLELLEASTPSSIFALHRWAKLAGAIYIADSVLEGCYETGWARRSNRLANSSTDRAIDRLARDWIPFLLRPELESAPPRRLELLRQGLSELFSREALQDENRGQDLAAAFIAIPTTLRQRLREWRHESRSRGYRWAVKSRFASTPQNRRLGLATAYWTFGPDRPEPVWGGEGENSGANETDVPAWANASRCLRGQPLGSGPGTRARVLDLVLGASL